MPPHVSAKSIYLRTSRLLIVVPFARAKFVAVMLILWQSSASRRRFAGGRRSLASSCSRVASAASSLAGTRAAVSGSTQPCVNGMSAVRRTRIAARTFAGLFSPSATSGCAVKCELISSSVVCTIKSAIVFSVHPGTRGSLAAASTYSDGADKEASLSGSNSTSWRHWSPRNRNVERRMYSLARGPDDGLVYFARGTMRPRRRSAKDDRGGRSVRCRPCWELPYPPLCNPNSFASMSRRCFVALVQATCRMSPIAASAGVGGRTGRSGYTRPPSCR
jgi:hypothetical protein